MDLGKNSHNFNQMLPSLAPTFKLRFIQLKGLYGHCRRNQTDLLFNFQDLIVINSSL